MPRFRVLFCPALSVVLLTGCNPGPLQSSPFGVCGGYYSEHDVKRKHDLSVTNAGDDLVFHYTNVSGQMGRKPVWSMPESDTLYYLHLQHGKTTIGCLDPQGYPDWKTQPYDDPKWALPADQSVSKRFSQERVWKSIRTDAPQAVRQEGVVMRFNFDGFASNACTVHRGEGMDQWRLECEQSTPTQRAKENRQRQSWWDRLSKNDQKERWEGSQR